MILISHDRHLIEATADRLWLVKDGAVRPFDGDMDDYRTEVTGVSANSKERREAEKANKADRRREAAARRQAAEPLASRHPCPVSARRNGNPKAPAGLCEPAA